MDVWSCFTKTFSYKRASGIVNSIRTPVGTTQIWMNKKKSQSGVGIFKGRWGIIRIQVKFLNTRFSYKNDM
jgi:hypothetical protein